MEIKLVLMTVGNHHSIISCGFMDFYINFYYNGSISNYSLEDGQISHFYKKNEIINNLNVGWNMF